MDHASAHAAVLRSCGMLFLFRAQHEAADESGRAHIEAQLVDMIAEHTGALGGSVFLGPCPPEPDGLAVSPGSPSLDVEAGVIACPILKDERVSGMIVARFGAGAFTREDLEHRLDTLIGLATVAGYALGRGTAVGSGGAAFSPVGSPAIVPDFPRIEIPGVIAESPAMQRVLRMVRRVAPAETTVLIEGESGAGKEVIARALHELSPRRSKPLIAINCAVLTENLLESELFGHERGAFTGAVAQKKGKVELAEGGTLFLDEIGELAPGLQAKLLRVLQQREFERVGGTRTLRLDVRVIAATNRDLLAEVKNGMFRKDLYHRLNVISIAAPALRERPDDIVPLAIHFLRRERSRAVRDVAGISAAAQHILLKYAWPGNVRELENVIERALVLGDAELIESEDLPDLLQQPPETPAAPEFEESIDTAKRDSIRRAWAESKGDYRQAAVILGIHPNSLLRLLKKLNLRSELRS